MPERFKNVKVNIAFDAMAIKEALGKGETVEGCSLIEGEPTLKVK